MHTIASLSGNIAEIQMPRIGLITDNWGPSLVRQALGDLRDGGHIQLETIEDFRTVDSLERAVWGLINLVDVVVASASKNEPNLFYEIGLAHGLGKPVVVVEEVSTLRLPPFLASQRTLRVDQVVDTSETLAFRLQQAIQDAQSRGRPFSGPRSVPSARKYATATQSAEIEDFRSLFTLPVPGRGARFERWLKSMAQAVPGWEVISAEQPPHQTGEGFDLVIWNSREDSDLQALGNPIGVECSAFNADRLRHTLWRAKQSGLKGLVLATMELKSAAFSRQVVRAGRSDGILAIALDREDLIDVRVPDHLMLLLKRKIRELQFGGDA